MNESLTPTEQQTLARIPAPLLEWYGQSHRSMPWRDPIVPYHTWLSEIMLQQTRVEAATDYYYRFLGALPTIASLAQAPEQQLLKLWEGLGYYNRVRNLQKAAVAVMEQYGGELPADYEALQKLPGIGKYTAGAIGSIAFSLPVPAVDGNVLRVLSRVLGSRRSIGRPQTKRAFEDALTDLLEASVQISPGDFNQALMELGALVCVPNGEPKCLCCPLEHFCAAHLAGVTDEIPVKEEKKARTAEEKTVLLLHRDGRYALRRRGAKGLLASLWEFPNADGLLDEVQLRKLLADWGAVPAEIRPLGKAKHIFSHVEWHMTGYFVELQAASDLPDFIWASRREFDEDYPLPSAFKAYRGEVV